MVFHKEWFYKKDNLLSIQRQRDYIGKLDKNEIGIKKETFELCHIQDNKDPLVNKTGTLKKYEKIGQFLNIGIKQAPKLFFSLIRKSI